MYTQTSHISYMKFTQTPHLLKITQASHLNNTTNTQEFILILCLTLSHLQRSTTFKHIHNSNSYLPHRSHNKYLQEQERNKYIQTIAMLLRQNTWQHPRTRGPTKNLGKSPSLLAKRPGLPQWLEHNCLGKRKEYGLVQPRVLSMETYASKILKLCLKGHLVQNHANLVLKAFMHN